MATHPQGLAINCFNITAIVIVYLNGCQLLMIKVLISELETEVFDNTLHKPLKFIYEFPRKTLWE